MDHHAFPQGFQGCYFGRVSQPNFMRYQTNEECEVIEFHLAVLYDVRQGLIDDGEKSFSAPPVSKSLPSLCSNTGQSFVCSGVSLMCDDNDVTVFELLRSSSMVRMVRNCDLTTGISVDVRHHFVGLSLETCYDHDAYGVDTVSRGGVQLGLDAGVDYSTHGLA
ncbi:hypothetical protein ACVWZV_003372 [Bradyrhizobium sp. GM5.1]